MAWTGFTDDQLRSLKRQVSDETQSAKGGHEGSHRERRGPPQGHQPHRGRGRSGPNRGQGRGASSRSGRLEPVSQDQLLSRPKQSQQKGGSPGEHDVWNELKEPTQPRPPPARRKPTPAKVEEEGTEKGASRKPTDEEGKNPFDEKKEVVLVSQKQDEPRELDETEGHTRELSKLEEFQQKQKQMEEENARRKALLARAIADRKKKTQAEAKRLAYIQKELAKIETLLTNDVSILRNKIETASRAFNEAQRRYQRAETEFVEAKMNLHKASEMKEALTEHLCTIIHENELRKSKKLEELVSKLDVESLEEFENIPDEITPKPGTPTSPTQKVPPQNEVTTNPSEPNGDVHQSSGVAVEQSAKVADSSITAGGSTVASVEGHSEDDKKESGKDKEMKGEYDSASVILKSKDEESETVQKDASPSDQPEAEQHVESSENQT